MLIALLYDMAATNLAYIEKMLRAGKTPEQLGGKDIGGGVCKRAYLFNNSLVVKLNAQGGWDSLAQKHPPKWINQVANVRGPRTYKAGRYIIQEYVKVLASLDCWDQHPIYKTFYALRNEAKNHKDGYDMHSKNCGLGSDGMLVVFDW